MNNNNNNQFWITELEKYYPKKTEIFAREFFYLTNYLPPEINDIIEDWCLNLDNLNGECCKTKILVEECEDSIKKLDESIRKTRLDIITISLLADNNHNLESNLQEVKNKLEEDIKERKETEERFKRDISRSWKEDKNILCSIRKKIEFNKIPGKENRKTLICLYKKYNKKKLKLLIKDQKVLSLNYLEEIKRKIENKENIDKDLLNIESVFCQEIINNESKVFEFLEKINDNESEILKKKFENKENFIKFVIILLIFVFYPMIRFFKYLFKKIIKYLKSNSRESEIKSEEFKEVISIMNSLSEEDLKTISKEYLSNCKECNEENYHAWLFKSKLKY